MKGSALGEVARDERDAIRVHVGCAGACGTVETLCVGGKES